MSRERKAQNEGAGVNESKKVERTTMVRMGRKDKNNNTFYRKNVETAEKSWERFGLEKRMFLVGEREREKGPWRGGGAKPPDQGARVPHHPHPHRPWSKQGLAARRAQGRARVSGLNWLVSRGSS